MYADVALNVPLRAGDRVFTFSVPPPLRSQIALGTAVRVPFGRQAAVGFVVAGSEQTTRRVRAIAGVEDRIPRLPADLVALAWWMAERYVCSVGEAVAAMIPSLTAALRKRPAGAPAIVAPAPAAGPPAAPTGVLPLLEERSHAVAAIGEESRFDAYAEALQWVLGRGQGALVLVPEVAQAERMAVWAARRSGTPALLLAGHLPEHERWEIWNQIRSEKIRLVVGTRLAVFAPFPRLGLIIVDHEEDTSYKEEREPRYHACRVAEQRARAAGIPILWGTPAPSLEVVKAIEDGQAAAVPLAPASRPTVAVSDVRAEAGPLGGLFGRRLYQALARTLPRGRAIIFVPRRGYADFLLCHECGAVPRCPRCGVALTFHLERGNSAPRPRTPARVAELRCHLCGRVEPVPEVCPACQGTRLRPHGLGTERVEQAARRLFRAVPLLRLDTESAPDEPSQQRVWKQFERRGGLLVGTQLVIKGVGQVRAAVVGAVGVDAGLHLPDFRAAERMHQMLVRLTRLAESEMIIQTFSPTHPALTAVARQDPAKFYRDELASRQRFGYPPFRPLINLITTGPREDPVRAAAAELAEALAAAGEVLGPSPAPISRLRGRFRWQLLIKEREDLAVRRRLSALLREWKLPKDVKLTVDVDPVDLL